MYPAKIDIEPAPVDSPPVFQPGRLWSWWDMIRAYGYEFATVDRMINHAVRWMPQNEQALIHFEAHNKKTARAWLQDDFTNGLKWLAVIPIGSLVRKQYARFLELLENKDAKLADLVAALNNLNSRWRDDIEDTKFLYVPPDDADLYEDQEHFGTKVAEAFPSSVLEITDAARCLALNQGTASVFHCMRALEPALLALGAPFKVDVAANWNAALNDIEKAIRARDKKDWPNWKAEEPFYTEACTHFFMIKNAWRNHTMHLRLRFSPAEAGGIYDTTGTFMKHLATRLSEPEGTAFPAQA